LNIGFVLEILALHQTLTLISDFEKQLQDDEIDQQHVDALCRRETEENENAVECQRHSNDNREHEFLYAQTNLDACCVGCVHIAACHFESERVADVFCFTKKVCWFYSFSNFIWLLFLLFQCLANAHEIARVIVIQKHFLVYFFNTPFVHQTDENAMTSNSSSSNNNNNELAIISAPPFPIAKTPILEALVKKVVKNPLIFTKEMLQPHHPHLSLTFNCDACDRADLKIIVKCHQAPDIDLCIVCYNARVEALLSKKAADRSMVIAAKRHWEETRATEPNAEQMRQIQYSLARHDFSQYSIASPLSTMLSTVRTVFREMPPPIDKDADDAGNDAETPSKKTSKKRKHTK
jgi:hypothetical protein